MSDSGAPNSMPSAPRPVEQMCSDLESRVSRVGNAWVRQLLGTILDRHGDRLRVWPAALSGNLIGHITMGVMLVRDAARTLEGFPEDLLTRIEHVIVSHHGARELGSPVEPMTEEAFILSSIDDLDATLHQFRRHVQNDPGEGEFTAYHPRLRRALLKLSDR